MEQDAATINDIKIPYLFWADDLVLISTTKDGLQNQLNVVNDYCSDWKLTLNAEKIKTEIHGELRTYLLYIDIRIKIIILSLSEKSKQ